MASNGFCLALAKQVLQPLLVEKESLSDDMVPYCDPPIKSLDDLAEVYEGGRVAFDWRQSSWLVKGIPFSQGWGHDWLHPHLQR